jgi:nucleoside-diphosphate-sugar epimerase
MTPEVLLTGATGFLGRAVYDRFQAEGGWSVTGTGRHRERSAGLEQFQPADLATEPDLFSLVKGKTAIVHCAARTSPWGPAAQFQLDNVVATGRLLEAAISCGVRRFIYISTPSIYAEYADRESIKEDDAPASRPLNHYVRSKLAAERMVMSRSEEIGVIVLRPHALIGPGDRTLLPRLMRAARRGMLPVIGNGANRADLTCVENAAAGCVLAVNAEPVCCGEAFNLTNNEPGRLWELLTGFLSNAGLPAPRFKIPIRVALGLAWGAESAATFLRRGEPVLTRYGVAMLGYSHTFDISKARRLLSYQPALPLALGLERVARWYRDHV